VTHLVGDQSEGKNGLRFEISEVQRLEEISTVNPRGTRIKGLSAPKDWRMKEIKGRDSKYPKSEDPKVISTVDLVSSVLSTVDQNIVEG
jgi:hypothetical protein